MTDFSGIIKKIIQSYLKLKRNLMVNKMII